MDSKYTGKEIEELFDKIPKNSSIMTISDNYNVIYYTTASNQILNKEITENSFNESNGNKGTIVSHTYKNDLGRIEFSVPIIEINEGVFFQTNLKTIILPTSVIKIGVKAFRACTDLISISGTENIKSIEAQAFQECSDLSFITLPNIKSIEAQAFYKSGLESIDLSDGLEVIGSYCFGETQLSNFIIPINTKKLGVGILLRTMKLESLTINGNPEFYNDVKLDETVEEYLWEFNSLAADAQNLKTLIINAPIERIGRAAFTNTSISHIQLPKSLKTIGFGAFQGTKLTSIELPEGLQSIGKQAFALCKITKVIIPASVEMILPDAFQSTLTSTESRDPLTVYMKGSPCILEIDATDGIYPPFGPPETVTIYTRYLYYNTYMQHVSWQPYATEGCINIAEEDDYIARFTYDSLLKFANNGDTTNFKKEDRKAVVEAAKKCRRIFIPNSILNIPTLHYKEFIVTEKGSLEKTSFSYCDYVRGYIDTEEIEDGKTIKVRLNCFFRAAEDTENYKDIITKELLTKEEEEGDENIDLTKVYEEISKKQDTLVSGQNIKTINKTSLLGSGDITIGAVSNLTVNSFIFDKNQNQGFVLVEGVLTHIIGEITKDVKVSIYNEDVFFANYYITMHLKKGASVTFVFNNFDNNQLPVIIWEKDTVFDNKITADEDSIYNIKITLSKVNSKTFFIGSYNKFPAQVIERNDPQIVRYKTIDGNSIPITDLTGIKYNIYDGDFGYVDIKDSETFFKIFNRFNNSNAKRLTYITSNISDLPSGIFAGCYNLEIITGNNTIKNVALVEDFTLKAIAPKGIYTEEKSFDLRFLDDSFTMPIESIGQGSLTICLSSDEATDLPSLMMLPVSVKYIHTPFIGDKKIESLIVGFKICDIELGYIDNIALNTIMFTGIRPIIPKRIPGSKTLSVSVPSSLKHLYDDYYTKRGGKAVCSADLILEIFARTPELLDNEIRYFTINNEAKVPISSKYTLTEGASIQLKNQNGGVLIPFYTNFFGAGAIPTSDLISGDLYAKNILSSESFTSSNNPKIIGLHLPPIILSKGCIMLNPADYPENTTFVIFIEGPINFTFEENAQAIRVETINHTGFKLKIKTTYTLDESTRSKLTNWKVENNNGEEIFGTFNLKGASLNLGSA